VPAVSTHSRNSKRGHAICNRTREKSGKGGEQTDPRRAGTILRGRYTLSDLGRRRLGRLILVDGKIQVHSRKRALEDSAKIAAFSSPETRQSTSPPPLSLSLSLARSLVERGTLIRNVSRENTPRRRPQRWPTISRRSSDN